LVIKATDEAGNQTVSPAMTFSTGKDTIAPVISKIMSDLALSPRGDKAQAVISWETSEPTPSEILYRQGNNGAQTTFYKQTPTKQHLVVLTLKPATVYLFQVRATDAAGNSTISDNYTFLTPQEEKTVVEIIIDNFTKTFGWMRR